MQLSNGQPTGTRLRLTRRADNSMKVILQRRELTKVRSLRGIRSYAVARVHGLTNRPSLLNKTPMRKIQALLLLSRPANVVTSAADVLAGIALSGILMQW